MTEKSAINPNSTTSTSGATIVVGESTNTVSVLATSDQPFTKMDFERALRRVSRPIKRVDQPDEGKSET